MNRRPRPSRPSRRLRVVLLLAAAALTVGCSAIESLLGTDEPASVAEVEEAVKAPAEDPDAVEPVDGTEVVDEPEPDAATAAAELDPAIALGLPGIDLVTPTSGEGPRPVLRWEPVPDADSYLVVVREGVGAPASWAWSGTNTEVRVGYVTQPGLGGPEIQPGMVWSVLAFGADDAPIAQSAERPIAP